MKSFLVHRIPILFVFTYCFLSFLSIFEDVFAFNPNPTKAAMSMLAPNAEHSASVHWSASAARASMGRLTSVPPSVYQSKAQNSGSDSGSLELGVGGIDGSSGVTELIPDWGLEANVFVCTTAAKAYGRTTEPYKALALLGE